MADEIVARYRLETEAAAANARKLADANDKVTKSGVQAQGSLDKMGQSATNMGRQLAGALGVTAGIAGVVMVLKSAGAAMIDFEYQMAKVKAVTGATDAEFTKLVNNAKNLGATTKFTATEVGQLQEEYAKLGYTTPEILKATEATLLLATATGSTLAQAAEVAGSVIKQFGLDASETQRVADVMAASFNKSALSMDDFAEAMKYVGPLARAANVDVETTSALLGKLADAGLKGSIAGTSLANLLTKLADANSDVSKAIGFNVNSSEDLFKALKALEGANIDLTAATELTDERSKKAFLTLLRGVDDSKALAAELRNVEGATKAMSDIMTDTSRGAIDNLMSALEGLALAIDQSGLIQKMTDITTQAVKLVTGAVKGESPLQTMLAILAEGANVAATEFERLYAVESQGSSILKINAEIRERQNKANEAYLADNTELHASLQAEVDAMERVRDARLRAARSGFDDAISPDMIVESAEKANESAKAQIRNIFFLTNAIKALNEEAAKEGTTRERILEINKQLKPLEEDLAFLKGKQAKEAENAAEYLKKLKEAVGEYSLMLAKSIPGLRQFAVDSNGIGNSLNTLREMLNQAQEQFNSAEINSDAFKQAKADIEALSQAIEEAEGNAQISLDKMYTDVSSGILESAQLTREALEQEAKGMMQIADQLFNAIGTMSQAVTSMTMNAIQAESDAVEQQYRRREITQEQYEARQLQLRRKAAQAQKDQAQFSVIMNTSSAIMNALQTEPFYVGLALAAIAAAMGAAETAAIQSAPLPQFAKGGWVEGKKHTEGGTMIEAEKGEFIVSAAAAKRYAPILEQINKQTFQPPKDGWEGLAASISLNSQFTDRNLLAAIDRHRETDKSGFDKLASAILRASRGHNIRRGWN